ncbi:MAG: D-alanyl-D-alanine carboxypeptidase/D-alanyl-D-alanine-endopeptidase, partial [Actinomycetota bacterium]|nr:D-alanyl-D-alanine carboxypeptidase/D-alanyl-D-alanine-endopeptidase [Actinomycetota bacterium]
RSATPEVEAGRALAGRLGVGAVPVTRGVAPAGAAVLASVHSATALDLVEQMLSQSDNVLADMLARWVARVVGQPASFAGAVTAVRQALAGQGIGLPSTMVDGSGLSPTDRLSPAVLVALLRAALLGAHPRLRQLISALPVAGWDGTLAGRYRVAGSAAGAGEIRAKTGTLTGVVTLAGIVRNRQGRWLVFALMTDRVPTGALTPAEAALDRAVARLAACRCR